MAKESKVSKTNNAEISQDPQRGVRGWGAQAASLQGLFFIKMMPNLETGLIKAE